MQIYRDIKRINVSSHMTKKKSDHYSNQVHRTRKKKKLYNKKGFS